MSPTKSLRNRDSARSTRLHKSPRQGHLLYCKTARLIFAICILLLVGFDLVNADDGATKEAPEKGTKKSNELFNDTEASMPEPSNVAATSPSASTAYPTPTRSHSIFVASKMTPTASPHSTATEANSGEDISNLEEITSVPSIAPTLSNSPSQLPSAITSNPTTVDFGTMVPTSELSTMFPSGSLGPSTTFSPTTDGSQEKDRPTGVQLPDVAIDLTFSVDSELTFTTEDVHSIIAVYLQDELKEDYGNSTKYEFSQLWMKLEEFDSSTSVRRRLTVIDETHRFFFLSGFALFEDDILPSIQEFTDVVYERLSAENLIELLQASKGDNGLSSVQRVSVGPGVRPDTPATDGNAGANRSTGSVARKDDGSVLPSALNSTIARVVLIVAGVVVLVSVGICVEVSRRHITGDPIPGLGMTLSSGGYFFDARSGGPGRKGFAALDDESDLAGMSPQSQVRGPSPRGRLNVSVPDSASSLAGLSIEESVAQSSYTIDDGWVTAPRYEEQEVIYDGSRHGRILSMSQSENRRESADEDSSSYLPRR